MVLNNIFYTFELHVNYNNNIIFLIQQKSIIFLLYVGLCLCVLLSRWSKWQTAVFPEIFHCCGIRGLRAKSYLTSYTHILYLHCGLCGVWHGIISIRSRCEIKKERKSLGTDLSGWSHFVFSCFAYTYS